MAAFEGMGDLPNSLRIVGAFLSALPIGVLWRKWLRELWQCIMRKLNVHRDDGVYGSWDKLLQEDRQIGQVSVYAKNGHVLHLNDRRRYHGKPWEGLYLGSDESIIMAVEEEELPDGTPVSWGGISVKDWGIRLTHIPAAEICRVTIRMKFGDSD